MTHFTPSHRGSNSRIQRTLITLAVAIAVIATVLAVQLLTSISSVVAPGGVLPGGSAGGAANGQPLDPQAGAAAQLDTRDDVNGGADADRVGPPADGRVTIADGLVDSPSTVSIYDTDVPTVANLDPALYAAVVEAAQAAASEEGIQFQVNSGWRSAEYQQQLLDDAIAEYGSAEEAARWVSRPDQSAHVTGNAIDIGSWDAAEWMTENGSRFGLCQVYENEPWHYELVSDARQNGCGPLFRDPSEDPRMR